MNQFDTLTQLENFYHMFQPAQENSKEAFVWVSGIPHPFLNVVNLSCSDAAQKVDSLIEQTAPHIPISFWVHPGNHSIAFLEVLKERGFKTIITCPVMTWPVKSVKASVHDIRPAEREIFHRIISDVYEFNEEVHQGFQKLMENAECENYLCYEDGKPVATASFFINGSVGAIFNDATVPGRREASRALTQFLMHRSHELNLTKLMVLSSPEGEELYSNLGFENLFNIEFYSR